MVNIIGEELTGLAVIVAGSAVLGQEDLVKAEQVEERLLLLLGDRVARLGLLSAALAVVAGARRGNLVGRDGAGQNVGQGTSGEEGSNSEELHFDSLKSWSS